MPEPTGQPQLQLIRGGAGPVLLTISPRLDSAVTRDWQEWETAAKAAGAEQTANWIARRMSHPELRNELIPIVEHYFDTSATEERAAAIAELAEIVEGKDDELADTLWESLLALGKDVADPDLIVEAVNHLAWIAEEYGDPLAAAEYHLEFLNWRREDGHSSEAEAVSDSFDSFVELAKMDGELRLAAIFEFKAAHFQRLADAGDDRATTGNWEADTTAFASWA